MSLVMAMQFDHNGDHQVFIMLARQVITSNNSTLDFMRKTVKQVNKKLSTRGKSLDRCPRVCNKTFHIGMEVQIFGSDTLLDGPQLSSDHQTVNMPPDLGQESDINSAGK